MEDPSEFLTYLGPTETDIDYGANDDLMKLFTD